jgi:hypothetical protein
MARGKGIVDTARKGGKFLHAAVKPDHRGLFAAKAKAAGETTAQYADQEYHAKGTLGKEARFAKTAMKLGRKK